MTTRTPDATTPLFEDVVASLGLPALLAETAAPATAPIAVSTPAGPSWAGATVYDPDVTPTEVITLPATTGHTAEA